MDITDEQFDAMRTWAEGEMSISELWLFGSRAKGTARSDSDADIALRLPYSTADAEFKFFDRGEGWQNRLRDLTGLEVNIVPLLGSRTPKHECAVNEHGILLFKRSAATSGHIPETL